MVPVIIIVVEVFLVLFGIYTLKHNPESWSYSLRTGMEHQDWSSTIYVGAFLIAGGIVL